ncbi:Inner membrane protein yhaI [Actinomyces bovis]|uniref:Inner membrane protein yhaI n=1 Tax=Actinomyces bovis TaxID=1658 RepID=A0ABY1VPH4_9ACTO|nr:DUF805 domain-containing protein [Actinomyces bovis]SPT54026.1 Inner membrane protein yhaI [Actinomyces bovis]VEG53829.1 Inner membrane protein yhaI [Actinomyces israelii]
MNPPVYFPDDQTSSASGNSYETGSTGGLRPYPSQATIPSKQEWIAAMRVPAQLAPAYGVSPVEAYKRYFKRAFTFTGYASRSEYWWAWLVNALIALIFCLLLAASAAASKASGVEADPTSNGYFVATAGAFLLFNLFNAVPRMAVFFRRMHDSGRSGLWLLVGLAPFGPVILLVLACTDSRPERWRAEWSY